VLTHFHADHAGAAAEVAAWSGVQIAACHADAVPTRRRTPGCKIIVGQK
jgi:glyoxylase-like metal-dependent hydrolase (beta-lactamase superfamily II)